MDRSLINSGFRRLSYNEQASTMNRLSYSQNQNGRTSPLKNPAVSLLLNSRVAQSRATQNKIKFTNFFSPSAINGNLSHGQQRVSSQPSTPGRQKEQYPKLGQKHHGHHHRKNAPGYPSPKILQPILQLKKGQGQEPTKPSLPADPPPSQQQQKEQKKEPEEPAVKVKPSSSKSKPVRAKSKDVASSTKSRTIPRARTRSIPVMEAAAKLSFPWRPSNELEELQNKDKLTQKDKVKLIQQMQQFFKSNHALLKLLPEPEQKMMSGTKWQGALESRLDKSLHQILSTMRVTLAENGIYPPEYEYKPIAVPNWEEVETSWPGFERKPLPNWTDYTVPSRVVKAEDLGHRIYMTMDKNGNSTGKRVYQNQNQNRALQGPKN